jgi:DNA repair protein RecN (Recombination protein N)
MLAELHIEGVGVIDHLDLLLGPGFTVFTGETGAGKTMIVEAIGLLTGGRADSSMVRPGAAEARIEGRFIIDDEEHVVARVVPADGRARAYIDGRLATVAGLAELTARAVDLHGQHDHQRLLAPALQRHALDRWCRADLTDLRHARARLTEIDAALAAFGGDARSRAREVDLLRFQHQELDKAGLTDADEERRIDDELDVLSSASSYRAAGERAIELLGGDGGAGDQLGEALAELGRGAHFASLAAELRDTQGVLADVVAQLRTLVEGIEEDPARLDELRERRALLRELRKKYGDTLADVLAFAGGVASRLAELESYDARVAELEAERCTAEVAERAAAARVGAVRRAGAAGLAEVVEARVRDLAMPHARVAVQVGDDDPGDEVTFLLAANPGGVLQPLHRVASGGELARAMLALRLVLSEAPETLLFDEVDAGIGGAAAVAVGAALAELGSRHQVLVVTHLAQVAAGADTHVVVRKDVVEGNTFASVAAVAGDDRVDEIARMLSGDLGGQPARSHAAALIEQCQRSGRR